LNKRRKDNPVAHFIIEPDAIGGTNGIRFGVIIVFRSERFSNAALGVATSAYQAPIPAVNQKYPRVFRRYKNSTHFGGTEKKRYWQTSSEQVTQQALAYQS
jgi:hypothetical protein